MKTNPAPFSPWTTWGTLLIITAALQGPSFSVSAIADSAGIARLDSGEGARFDGKPIAAGQTLLRAGEILTDALHPAQITLLPSRTQITLRPGTRLILAAATATGDETETLREGMIRARINHRPSRSFHVKTMSATLGVRGTDFMAVSNPLLGETEIIVFNGSVDFESASDPTDHKLVTEGHWGGVGGRFGKRIGDLITLPANVLQHFDQFTQ